MQMKLEVPLQYALNVLFLPIPAPIIVLDGPEMPVTKHLFTGRNRSTVAACLYW